MEVKDAWDALARSMGAKWMFPGDTTPVGLFYGEEEDDLPPEEHRSTLRKTSVKCNVVDRPEVTHLPVWEGDPKDKEGRKLRKKMREMKRLSAYALDHDLGCGPFFHKGYLWHVGVIAVGEDTILSIHKDSKNVPPDAIPIKRSEYWLLREAHEEAQAHG
jgi:hypothetical protein